MASGPITSWKIEGEKVEVMTDFLFLGSKITADGDFRHEIRWQFLLGRKAVTNLDSVLQSRDITLLTKVHIVKAMVFPVVTNGCESWTVKKAEHWRTVLLEKTPESPLDSKEIKPVNLNTHWKNWHWSWSSSILATWGEEVTHWKSPWCWERLRGEGEEGIRGWNGWMASPMQWTSNWANFGRWWGTGRPDMLQSMGSKRVGHNWVTKQQQYNNVYILIPSS